MPYPIAPDSAPRFRRFRLPLLFLAYAASFALFGCGRTSETPAAPDTKSPAPAATGDFKVALVTTGSISDNGWNANAYKALQDVKAATGADIQNVEAKTTGEQEENIRAYAVKNFNVVLAHGGELGDMTLKIANDFPKTQFLVASGRKSAANVTPVVLRMEDSAYLMGMLAANMSKTGKIGSVGAQKVDALIATFAAFEAGAKAAKPGITVIPPAYTGDWEDVAKGKAQTLALIDQGADVIMDDLDAAAAGVFAAAKSRTSPDKPIYVMATNKDQNADAPDVILASAPIYIEKAYVPITTQIKAGAYKYNAADFYGMKSGAIDFVLNPALQGKIPPAVKAKLDETKKKILDGSLDTTKG